MSKRAVTRSNGRASTKRKAARPAARSHQRVLAAARRAVREALKTHKAEGLPIIVWRDGKIKKVPAKDI